MFLSAWGMKGSALERFLLLEMAGRHEGLCANWHLQ